MGIKGFARRRWVAERVGSRRRNQGRRQPLRHRGLRIEQFEERMLLSVAPVNVTDQLINQVATGSQYLGDMVSTQDQAAPGTNYNGTGTTVTPVTGQSVATDNKGDFVVVWTRYDNTTDSLGNTISDANIYARYYTDAVQRIDLPVGAKSFKLQYNGNEIQKLSISAGTQPFQSFPDSISGSFDLTYTDPSSGNSYTSTVNNYDEYNPPTYNATLISDALNNIASQMTFDGLTALNGVTVQAIDADNYQINFGNASGGQGNRRPW